MTGVEAFFYQCARGIFAAALEHLPEIAAAVKAALAKTATDADAPPEQKQIEDAIQADIAAGRAPAP